MRVFLVLALFACIARADHLPESLLAQGPREVSLCGINVYHSRVPELMKKFGKPFTYEKYPKTEEAAEMVWHANGSKIHVTVNTIDIAYAVSVEGKPSDLTSSGRGLRLGQTLDDLKRIYGNRFLKQGNNITLQWADGTELRASLRENHVIALTLIAAVE